MTSQVDTNTIPKATISGCTTAVSRILQGGMMFKTSEQARWDAFLDEAVALGINGFDTGHVYGGGDCERALGTWMQSRGNRDTLFILDKGCHPSGDGKRVTPEAMRADLAESLERLQTEYIDLWMFHRDDPAMPVGPLVEAANEEIQAGRIRAYGGSNWSHTRIADANAYAAERGLTPMVASSPNFSLAAQIDSPWGSDCLTISGPENTDAREWYAHHAIAVFPWSSLARGFLSGRLTRANFESVKDQFEEHTIRCYVCDENWERLERAATLAQEKGLTVAQVALAYVLNQPMTTFALVGAYSQEELRANVQAAQCRLSREECAWLDLRGER